MDDFNALYVAKSIEANALHRRILALEEKGELFGSESERKKHLAHNRRYVMKFLAKDLALSAGSTAAAGVKSSSATPTTVCSAVIELAETSRRRFRRSPRQKPRPRRSTRTISDVVNPRNRKEGDSPSPIRPRGGGVLGYFNWRKRAPVCSWRRWIDEDETRGRLGPGDAGKNWFNMPAPWSTHA